MTSQSLNETAEPFQIEEATIDELHAAIRSGRTTCVEVVERYITRVRAYNGVSSLLVTEDGAPVAQVPGTVRGGAPLAFPTETVAVDSILPDRDRYRGFFGDGRSSDAVEERRLAMIDVAQYRCYRGPQRWRGCISRVVDGHGESWENPYQNAPDTDTNAYRFGGFTDRSVRKRYKLGRRMHSV